jgi:hypothetical protein
MTLENKCAVPVREQPIMTPDYARGEDPACESVYEDYVGHYPTHTALISFVARARERNHPGRDRSRSSLSR